MSLSHHVARRSGSEIIGETDGRLVFFSNGHCSLRQRSDKAKDIVRSGRSPSVTFRSKTPHTGVIGI